MIRPNPVAASAMISFWTRVILRSPSKEDMLGSVHQRVNSDRREHAVRFLKNFAIGDACNCGQYHIAPVRQRLRSVIQMRTAEYKSGNQEHAQSEAVALHEPVLYQRAKEDLLRQRCAEENRGESHTDAPRGWMR